MYETIVLLLVLSVPLSLIMDFVHEFGHVLWGTVLGGKLTYIQIACLVIYPRLEITGQFLIGRTAVIDLPSEFAHGVYLLGGSLTTSIVSWLLAPILLKAKLGFKKRVGLTILGFFGIFDPPLYVVLPQIGLRHWIFIGGNTPEPLLGAKMMGVSDPTFYIIVVLSTLSLIFIYFKVQIIKARYAINLF